MASYVMSACKWMMGYPSPAAVSPWPVSTPCPASSSSGGHSPLHPQLVQQHPMVQQHQTQMVQQNGQSNLVHNMPKQQPRQKQYFQPSPPPSPVAKTIFGVPLNAFMAKGKWDPMDVDEELVHPPEALLEAFRHLSAFKMYPRSMLEKLEAQLARAQPLIAPAAEPAFVQNHHHHHHPSQQQQQSGAFGTIVPIPVHQQQQHHHQLHTAFAAPQNFPAAGPFKQPPHFPTPPTPSPASVFALPPPPPHHAPAHGASSAAFSNQQKPYSKHSGPVPPSKKSKKFKGQTLYDFIRECNAYRLR
ncbi:hypothetical protein HDU96_010155 [Phlyctochytrium bullatum]|nr:hypothetical protein HDU96_010155 [Phlyctochytrium bullatum]